MFCPMLLFPILTLSRITLAMFRKTTPTVIQIAALTSTKMARVIFVNEQTA